VAEFQANFWLYLSIPFIAGGIGYITKLLALEMMFEPVEFVGKPPYLGWQGVIPRSAEKMARIATGLLLGKIFKADELIARLDPQRIVKEIEGPLNAAADSLTRDMAEQYMPRLWNSMPEAARRRVIARFQAQIPEIVEDTWNELTQDISKYVDIQHMLVSNLVKDKELLNNVFREMAAKEFVFFRNAGFWFGLILGVVQLGMWMSWHAVWIMPLSGGIIGLVSDYIALQMLFRPLYPVRFLGLTLHGRFLSRQNEVARDYATLISKQLLTPANLIEELLNGPLADRVIDQIEKSVREGLESQMGWIKPIFVMSMGTDRYVTMRRHIVEKVIEMIPETSKQVEQYAMDALDVQNTIASRMDQLTPEEFEGLLRPAFKQDEWKLVACGAALGFIIGELQVHLMLT
jgi:uncharacterized membrane protein YheB (UPF0754 family)